MRAGSESPESDFPIGNWTAHETLRTKANQDYANASLLICSHPVRMALLDADKIRMSKSVDSCNGRLSNYPSHFVSESLCH